MGGCTDDVSEAFVASNPLELSTSCAPEHLPVQLTVSEAALQQRLQTIVKAASAYWTYAIFWELSHYPNGGIDAVLGDGYFNGHKEPERVGQWSSWNEKEASEEAQVVRKKVLKELQALVCNTDEDLKASTGIEYVSDTEWFYLVSMSYSFSGGVGMPGRALAHGSPVWLTGANNVSKTVCTRANSAKMAGIQTIVCVPTKNGVVEPGSTDLIDLLRLLRTVFDD